MAAKTLTEALKIGLDSKNEEILQSEVRDFLAHSVARYCAQNNCSLMVDYTAIANFVASIICELPAYKKQTEVSRETL